MHVSKSKCLDKSSFWSSLPSQQKRSKNDESAQTLTLQDQRWEGLLITFYNLSPWEGEDGKHFHIFWSISW